MYAVVFIQDLAIIMLVAGVITILCHRFNQPVVLGYILAGIILGPYTPPFMLIKDVKVIKTLAELGVIFLMFSLGLEFDLKKLKRVGFPAFIAAFAEILLMFLVGYGIGRLFHWTFINSIFLGAILSISSTTIIIKALEDLGMKKQKFANLIFGILIIEDFFAIAILALLSTIAINGTLAFNDIFVALSKLAAFLVISILLGVLLIPKILAYVAKFNNREMLLITSLALCFGFCILVMKLNYSVALGAFLIGAIIAESKELPLIERLVVPLRDTFSAIFFVTVGLLFDPQVVAQYPLPIIVITVAVVIGKILSASVGILLTGNDGKTAMKVGMGLAQIGEFSFIIAALGISLQVTGAALYPIAVAVSAITTLLTPNLIKYSDNISNQVENFMPKWLTSFYKEYKSWLENFKPRDDRVPAIKILQRNFMQVVVNLLIILAIFWAADFFPLTYLGQKLTHFVGDDIQRTISWNIAIILSLPFLVAVYRKLNTMCVVAVNFESLKFLRAIIPTLFIIALFYYLYWASDLIHPPLKLLFPSLLIPILILLLLHPWLVRIYVKTQIKLNSAFRNDKSN